MTRVWHVLRWDHAPQLHSMGPRQSRLERGTGTFLLEKKVPVCVPLILTATFATVGVLAPPRRLAPPLLSSVPQSETARKELPPGSAKQARMAVSAGPSPAPPPRARLGRRRAAPPTALRSPFARDDRSGVWCAVSVQLVGVW